MNKIYYFLLVFMTLSFFACDADEEMSGNGNVGYLRLSVGTSDVTNTKASDAYLPEQIAVQILDKKGEVVQETDDWTLWGGESIELKPGVYTVNASSAGFDGKAGYENAYYAGTKQVTIEEEKETNEEIVCTLANVKVTINFDEEFLEVFPTVVAKISDAEGGNALSFIPGDTKNVGYFPVSRLFSEITVVNKQGVSNTQSNELEDVKARDHFILTYKVAENGTGSIRVRIDDSNKDKVEVTIRVGDRPKTVNAWSKFALLSEVADATLVEPKFEYKLASASEWTAVDATLNGEAYEAKIEGLTPGSAYQYRLVGTDYTGSVVNFSTESATQLPNAGFEDWYQSESVWYAVAQGDFAQQLFWDSSNPGSGAFGFNPTTGDAEVKHSGEKSARLETQYAFIKLAAASLYAGRFGELVGINGAKINFGREFASRPTQFEGYFQYAPVNIDYVGSNQPANTVQKGDKDICSIYIALSKKAYEVDNTNTKTFIQFETDENIIAYGELPLTECVSTGGEWKKFTIPLKYKNQTDKPQYIILVASSSKYGDYFTGGKGSVLHLDDMSLSYDGEPTMWK